MAESKGISKIDEIASRGSHFLASVLGAWRPDDTKVRLISRKLRNSPWQVGRGLRDDLPIGAPGQAVVQL